MGTYCVYMIVISNHTLFLKNIRINQKKHKNESITTIKIW